MGSSFSIVNDTKQDVWIQNNTCWNAVIWPIAAVGTIATAGLAGAGVVAGAAGTTALVGTMEGVIAGTVSIAGTCLGITATTAGLAGAITSLTSGTVAVILGISQYEAEKLIKIVRKFKNDANMHLKPGEVYKFNGTLSLVRSVYVLGANLSRDNRDCWTGPTDGSNHEYTISEYFPNCALD